jgi:hypothetical protein
MIINAIGANGTLVTVRQRSAVVAFRHRER